MQFSELQTEFFAGGFEDLNDGGTGLARAKRLLNESCEELCEEERWPFLYANTSGAAPLTISDLAFVRTVTRSTNGAPLEFVDVDDLRDQGLSLTATGTPTHWYFVSPTQIATWPTSTESIRVDYVKTPARMVNNSDAPAVPDRFQFLVILGAWIKANLYKDNAGSESAAVQRGEWERGLNRMRALLVDQADGEVMRHAR